MTIAGGGCEAEDNSCTIIASIGSTIGVVNEQSPGLSKTTNTIGRFYDTQVRRFLTSHPPSFLSPFHLSISSRSFVLHTSSTHLPNTSSTHIFQTHPPHTSSKHILHTHPLLHSTYILQTSEFFRHHLLRPTYILHTSSYFIHPSHFE